MSAERGRCFEAVLTAVLAPHGLPQVVHGAQVEDEVLFEFDRLAAELAEELRTETPSLLYAS